MLKHIYKYSVVIMEYKLCRMFVHFVVEVTALLTY